MHIESYIWPYVEILHGDYDFLGIFVDLLSEDTCGHESTLHIFLQQAKLIILLEEQQFNSKVLGLDVLHYVDADSSLNAGFIFFISLWLKFCTSIIICLCIVVGLQSEKVLLTNPSYYAINYSMFITLVSSNTFLIFLSKLFGLYGHFISCLIRPSKYS